MNYNNTKIYSKKKKKAKEKENGENIKLAFMQKRPNKRD